VTLLRVLPEKEVVPLGATVPVPVDVRVIAATHQGLRGRIHDGLVIERPALRCAELRGASVTKSSLFSTRRSTAEARANADQLVRN
jgi:transcriptional regulator of acetoin/glycerol metabolism